MQEVATQRAVVLPLVVQYKQDDDVKECLRMAVEGRELGRELWQRGLMMLIVTNMSVISQSFH